MWLKDPFNKQPSVTLTFFSAGFVVALGKLVLSGVQVGEFIIQPFTGADFAAVVGALGGIYALRKMNNKKEKNDEKSN